MTEIDPKIVESVNRQGRVGILATADLNGAPNAAYFGSPHLNQDGTLVMGLGENRSLKNLEQNPQAVFFTVETSPVDLKTPGHRLYLKAVEIQREGELLDAVRQAIAQRAGEQAGKRIKAAVLFEVTEVRGLVDMG